MMARRFISFERLHDKEKELLSALRNTFNKQFFKIYSSEPLFVWSKYNLQDGLDAVNFRIQPFTITLQNYVSCDSASGCSSDVGTVGVGFDANSSNNFSKQQHASEIENQDNMSFKNYLGSIPDHPSYSKLRASSSSFTPSQSFTASRSSSGSPPPSLQSPSPPPVPSSQISGSRNTLYQSSSSASTHYSGSRSPSPTPLSASQTISHPFNHYESVSSVSSTNSNVNATSTATTELKISSERLFVIVECIKLWVKKHGGVDSTYLTKLLIKSYCMETPSPLGSSGGGGGGGGNVKVSTVKIMFYFAIKIAPSK
jgi:hypothetical protein